MSEELWAKVDAYTEQSLVSQDAALTQSVVDSEAAGLPSIQVSASQGKLLGLLARSIGARRILELGTLGGYSSIWLARALPADGRLLTLELEHKHAEVARKNLARAGVAERVEVRVGPALDTLKQLVAEKQGPFDLVFIDADKESLPDYFTWSLKLARVGSLIIVDNVVRAGAVADRHSTEPRVLGVRRMNELIAAESRVSATTLQTVGTKGYDGLTFVSVTS